MRTIKFRGKSITTGEWVYGDLIRTDTDSLIAASDMWGTEFSGGTIELQVEKVIPESVGQYAGFKDKNDKEIYEGDIVRVGEHFHLGGKWT